MSTIMQRFRDYKQKSKLFESTANIGKCDNLKYYIDGNLRDEITHIIKKLEPDVKNHSYDKAAAYDAWLKLVKQGAKQYKGNGKDGNFSIDEITYLANELETHYYFAMNRGMKEAVGDSSFPLYTQFRSFCNLKKYRPTMENYATWLNNKGMEVEKIKTETKLDTNTIEKITKKNEYEIQKYSDVFSTDSNKYGHDSLEGGV